MNFVILPSEDKMSVDNALLEEFETRQWIPANIEIVAWHGEAGSGVIEYKDRPRVMEETTRLEDYLAPIDAWLDAASKLTQPLQLSQAQNIKCDMVDALYMNKRKIPFGHGAWQYDTSDEAIGYMASMVGGVGAYDRIGELVSQTDTAMTSMKSSLDATVTTNNANANNVNTWSTLMAGNWGNLRLDWAGVAETGSLAWLTSHGHSLTYGLAGGAYQWDPFVLYRSTGSGMNTMSALAAPPSVATGGQTNVGWQPLNASSPVGINANEFRDALRIITDRRTALEGARAMRKNEIRALTSIAAVIAYDVAAGW